MRYWSPPHAPAIQSGPPEHGRRRSEHLTEVPGEVALVSEARLQREQRDRLLTIAGDVLAHLFASTTGTDADWVAKLIDVYPDSLAEPKMGGYELIVAADIMRGRYRTSDRTPRPIVPHQVADYTVDMEQQLYTFWQGHRIMVQVQSTWFPLYDWNPQTFVPNIFRAKPTDFRSQTHRIWRTPARPSHVSVRVLPRD